MTDKQPGRTSRCRSCDAEIVWCRTANGKVMPCDLKPDPAGDFFLFRRRDRIEAIHVRSEHQSAEKARMRGDKRYTSHFVTCANADKHRRKR